MSDLQNPTDSTNTEYNTNTDDSTPADESNTLPMMTAPIGTPVLTVTVPYSTSLVPRIRTGAIVWGVIVSALATAFLVATGTPERRASVAHWINGLSAETLGLFGLLALGIFIVLIAVVSAVNRAQRRSAR
jgi:hypothetical protein